MHGQRLKSARLKQVANGVLTRVRVAKMFKGEHENLPVTVIGGEQANSSVYLTGFERFLLHKDLHIH